MADLSVTAANVVPGSGTSVDHGTAGGTITAGQVVARDPADGKMKLADNNSATAALRSPRGVALHGASNNQPLAYATEGPVTIGATLTAGAAYYLSDTPGGICPVADLATGEYPSVLGMATSTSVLTLDIQRSGVAL